MKRFTGFVLLLVFGLLLISLGKSPAAEAGIYHADQEVTYKEYWVPHNQFTAGCTDDGLPMDPNGSWYAEPDTFAKCPKSMKLNIPDDIANALKAEIYVDLWRNYDGKSARLRINSNPTVFVSDVGSDWSRTPWVFEVPLSMLSQGENTLLFWGEAGKYHIHDVAVRIYYDDAHPLLPGGGSDVTPPDGELISITSLDSPQVEIPAYTGGQLGVNSNQLTLKANVAANASYIEFHAYYDGYDDDNDGEFHDWHNVSRNNWSPGGKDPNPPATGGTINHIGTVKVNAAGDVTTIWKLDQIINQSGVRFKIRIVDAAGNVREAAGGVTPEYTLARNYPVVYYTMPDFDDFGLHMSGARPDLVSYDFPLPNDLDLTAYNEAYLLGMYWKIPKFSLNLSPAATVRQGGDEWALGTRKLNLAALKPGINQLDYLYSGSGAGQFIERPGPMIVLKGIATLTPDTTAPHVISRTPASGAVNVDVFAPVSVRLGDVGSGVDSGSIIMSVNSQLVQPVLSGASNNRIATFHPTNPLPPNATIPVTIYACDLVGNCMTSAEQYSFTTEPPDATPPIISNINVITTDTSATVSWTTDEAATSKVEYGLTAGYEKPAVSDNALVTQHSIHLPGLQTATAYNFRLTSGDFSNNITITTNQTFQTKNPPGPIVSDDFSTCAIDSSIWSYINPKNDAPLTLTGAGAQIAVPTGSAHDLWRQGLLAPRLMQYVSDQDFDVEVKFDSAVTKKTQSMGLFVQQDATNWLRFNFQNDGVGSNSLAVANSTKNGVQIIFTTPVSISAPSYMRLNRAGNLWNLEYSTDGTNWSFATTITRTLVVSEIGPYIGNTSTNPAHTGVIDYFENLADPITSEDSPITLNVTKVGVGTVTRTPEKPNYNCNETVTLTAAPAADWVFAGWSGAIISSNPVETITLTESENVTAEFTNDNLYTMNVNVVSQGNGVGGTVTKSPNQGSYLYGTQVELEAIPTPGWSFLGWSGDWTGTTVTTTVPIIGNMNITATFDEDAYTLETAILADGIGQGATVTVDPVKPTYLYGDEVTLTAALQPGWTFIGWEGEGVSGTSPVLPITMTQNVVAVAHVAQNQYDVDVQIVNDGETPNPENGVLKSPEQLTYGHGQTITMTASPDNGWLFTGWAGDLTGTTPTQSLTITEDKAISATFTQEHYSVTVTTQGPGEVNISPVKPYYLYGDVVTLTPDAESGYELVAWDGDLTGSAEPAIIAVTKNMNIEAIFAVDTTPIEIVNHEIEVLPGGTLARIKWTTDVPGTSRVDFGETTFYDGGTVSKDDLVTQHSLVLTGLKPETFYHYRIISEDGSGNPVESEDLTFSTSASSGLVSDDFSSCDLDSRWAWVDPLDDSSNTVTGHQVEISVPADSIHEIWTTGYDAPRLMQPSNNTDLIIEVKFDSILTEGGAGQGIVIEQDAQNFLRFEFYLRTAPTELVVFAAGIKDLAQAFTPKSVRLTDFSAPVYMRVVRVGNVWQQWYSFNGENWTKSAEFTHELQVKKAGVFAANRKYKGQTPAHTAVIDYFFNTASPIVPEDSRYKLNFEIEGSGQVTTDPDQVGFHCGQEVELTAVGSPGWGFIGWGGDLTGSDPTQSVTVTGDMAIVARFQQGAAGYRVFMPLSITEP